MRPKGLPFPESCYRHLAGFLVARNPPVTKPVLVDGDANREIVCIFMPWVVFDPTVT